MDADDGYIAAFGDLHNHCNISYGHGTLEDALQNAALRLDFVSITGHADWPDMDADDPRIAHIVAFHIEGFAKLKSGWDHYLLRIAEFESEKDLVTFPGYEIHSNEHGDYTIVGYEHEFPMVLADSPNELRRLFAARGSRKSPSADSLPPAILFPHHIGYRRGARGVNWDAFDKRLSPLAEIYSMHGLADSDHSDKPSLHSMGPWQNYGTMQHGLSLGNRFGVLGNTDHHSGHPGSYGHGLTGVWTQKKSREDIWLALNQRRTWAMTGDVVRLWFSLGGVPMGGELSRPDATHSPDLPVEIVADATAAIDYVELVGNGTRLALWWRGDEAPGENEAIVSLELGWGERGKVADWDVELEIEGAEILNCIPRFRGPEVVSPLDKTGDEAPGNSAWRIDGRKVTFQTSTWGNMTNSTASTQGFAVQVNSPIQPGSRLP